MRIRTAALTDIGKVREENEDRFLCDEKLHLYAVADGIGGLAGGAQAAEEAVTQLTALTHRLSAAADWDFQSLFLTINQRVASLGQIIDDTFGIGTTLTVARLHGDRLQLAHVGDSSCYLLRDERLEKLTLDHTVENELKAKHGHGAALFLTPRTRNALTRCIGQPKAPLADQSDRPLRTGDRLLLCSDGITRFIEDRELAHLLVTAAEPAAGLKKIIDLASHRGGHDNATGVLIFVDAV
ncbi:MAG: protein phosphatase 2C domain-containing protein [Opitutaceae bacterium]|nr:protein phosphatase 2C domain-containing protein [Opitutaceae bacterium]